MTYTAKRVDVVGWIPTALDLGALYEAAHLRGSDAMMALYARGLKDARDLLKRSPTTMFALNDLDEAIRKVGA